VSKTRVRFVSDLISVRHFPVLYNSMPWSASVGPSYSGPVFLVLQVHEDPDDLGRGGFEDSNTTGHAGARLGCCRIVRAGAVP